ncbi:MAG TPA: amidohydrolase [Candidatus Faecimorpha stercoravium]|nr:amidohydrolase [Candidatus Faecimorpha stercoravium]
MKDIEFIIEGMERIRPEMMKVRDAIFNYAELPYKETKSAEILCETLTKHGFDVKRGLAEIPTCFTGEYQYGEGGMTMGLLGEFDALDGLSQEAGCTVQNPVEENAPGHGCGHCCLGTGALAAAILVKEYLETHQIPGKVIYYGCPAEEGAGAKQFMARAGLFDVCDFIYTWHPSSKNEVDAMHSNAIMGANFYFKGRTAHAGATPHLGRSALDAAELMSVGCNYLREHMIPEARLHYAYINAGGTAPNVVQDRAVVRYEVRAPYVRQTKELYDRVVKVAQGAAMMTETEVTPELAMAFTEYLPNFALARIADQCMQEIGAPQWDEADYRLAKQFLESFPEESKKAIRQKFMEDYPEDWEEKWEKPLDSEIHPFSPDKVYLSAGSTDVGDVGYAVPCLNLNVACACLGNIGHTWQMTAQAGSILGEKGTLAAGKMLALSCLRTMQEPQAVEEAKQEVLRRNGGRYTCPLPDTVKPPIDTY